MNVITSSHYNRPEFSKEMIKHLAQSFGVSNSYVIFCIDREKNGKINEEVLDLCKSFDSCEHHIEISKENIGCNSNIFKSLRLGFSKSNYVLHLEDDVLIAKDGLTLVEDVIRQPFFQNYWTLSLFNRSTKDQVGNQYNVITNRPWFTPSGFMCSKQVFLDGFQYGCFEPDKITWDMKFNELRAIRKKTELFPIMSRSNNIGWYGENVSSKEWYNDKLKMLFWADDISYQEEDFRYVQNQYYF